MEEAAEQEAYETFVNESIDALGRGTAWMKIDMNEPPPPPTHHAVNETQNGRGLGG